MFKALSAWISDGILAYLHKTSARYAPFFAADIDELSRVLQPCDVLLVEGNSRLSGIIKYLTQSTWSHAALYIGDALGPTAPGTEAGVLLEAEAKPGVHAVPLSKYASYNTRICRPTGLSAADRDKVVAYAVKRIGVQYDSKQIVDLARYLFPYPPVPIALRRRMLAIGSGDPTRAICSTLIGEAFTSIRYPILPESATIGGKTLAVAPYVQAEADHIRKHGLFTPRDFDISPYFEVVKPRLTPEFDFHKVQWEP